VGPSQWTTASRWDGFRESRENEEFSEYSAEKAMKGQGIQIKDRTGDARDIGQIAKISLQR